MWDLQAAKQTAGKVTFVSLGRVRRKAAGFKRKHEDHSVPSGRNVPY